MRYENTEGESGGGAVGYHAVKVSSHGKTRGQDISSSAIGTYLNLEPELQPSWFCNLLLLKVGSHYKFISAKLMPDNREE